MIGDVLLTFCLSLQKYSDVFSELTTADQDTHLEAAISVLDTMEGVAS